ncbi:MAG: class I SAM-dependent methyltransferase [Chloroflexota bacterium]
MWPRGARIARPALQRGGARRGHARRRTRRWPSSLRRAGGLVPPADGPAEYADEAAFILDLLRRHVDGPLETLLELGSGGGNTASHLRAHLALTLTDLAPAMLDLSRTLNPGCEHLVADMRTARLGRTFDAVLIHDAIMYMTTEADLRAALETAFVHLRPGGAAVFTPDCVRETFRPTTEHGGHDGAGRSLRYLEWSYDPDPDDTTFVTDFAILLREGVDDVRVRYDRHVEGLFARATWLDLLREVGFDSAAAVDGWQGDIFVGIRAPSP